MYKVLERLSPEDRWCLRLWPHPGEKPALPEFWGAADRAESPGAGL